MEDILKSVLYPILALMALNSCSWYRDMERSLVADDEKNSKKSRTVSREQYDNLLVKYEELTKKYELLKEGNVKSGQPSLQDELTQSSTENFSNTANPVETVDAFSSQAPAVVSATIPETLPQDLESQLGLFRKGLALRKTDQGMATKIFQQLENGAHPSIKARAKFQVGEMLLEKGQHDLALQVFEDIINKNSHSGIVLAALKQAQVCAEKLGIQNKNEQYTSMLIDVFGSK